MTCCTSYCLVTVSGILGMYIVLYCIVLYCIVSYRIVLYRIVLLFAELIISKQEKVG